jgi:hypothetical protein
MKETITQEEYLETILIEIKGISQMFAFLASSLKASLEENKRLEKRLAKIERKGGMRTR